MNSILKTLPILLTLFTASLFGQSIHDASQKTGSPQELDCYLLEYRSSVMEIKYLTEIWAKNATDSTYDKLRLVFILDHQLPSISHKIESKIGNPGKIHFSNIRASADTLIVIVKGVMKDLNGIEKYSDVMTLFNNEALLQHGGEFDKRYYAIIEDIEKLISYKTSPGLKYDPE